MRVVNRILSFLVAFALAFGVSVSVTDNSQSYAAFDEGASVESTYQNKAEAKKPTITRQPKTVNANEGEIVKFSVTASGKNLKYQWYYRKANGTTWIKSALNGNTTNSVSVKAYEYRNGQMYRCKVSNADGYVFSDIATVKVIKKPVITKEPQNVSVDLNGTAVFSVSATGDDLKYQWQYQTKNGSTWNDSTMSGARTNKVSVPVMARRDGYKYRCKVSGPAETVYSNSAKLDISSKPKIIMQSDSQTIMENNDVVMYLSAEGQNLQYQWQYRKGPEYSWFDSTQPGNTSFALTVTGTRERNGFQFRCKVSNPSGTVYTNPVTLTVIEAPAYQNAPYYGYLYFPGRGYGVDLYAYDGSVPSATIVDWVNSACFMNYATPLIADHVNQGFDIIKSFQPGEICTIDTCYGDTYTYECVEVDFNGTNSGNGIYLSDGRDATMLGFEYLSMYTCNSNWNSVTIVVFKLVN